MPGSCKHRLLRKTQLAKLIHQELGFKYELLDRKTTPPYYKYNPQLVVERGNLILYWDRPIVTDQTIDYNRPDILLINQGEKTATLVEIAVPLTHNWKKTEAEKKWLNMMNSLSNSKAYGNWKELSLYQ